MFLPGVGNFSPDEITSGERYFIDQLVARYSNCVAVRDVFPYSVVNQDLCSQKFLAPVWQAAKESNGALGRAFIQVRNLWRFAISADDRYGPVYNLSIARTSVERMNAAYPIPRSNRPINLILVSTSGGTQVALGTTVHLNRWINARLTVVSIGGAFEGRAGFNYVNHVYHLYGDRDWVTTLSRVVFPARWSWVVGSPVIEPRMSKLTRFLLHRVLHASRLNGGDLRTALASECLQVLQSLRRRFEFPTHRRQLILNPHSLC